MTSTAPLSAGIAFVAGLVSFVSPCVLPLVPAYLSLLTGESLEELREGERAAARALPHAAAFIAGFMIVFIVLGLTASELGALLGANRRVIAEIGGIVVIVLGLQMMGMIKRIPFIMRDTRVQVAHERRTLWTSLIVGIAFAAGWTPCIGPILAAILALASQQHNGMAAFLLLCYSLGLAVPFLLVAAAIDAILPWLARVRRALGAIEFVAGAFLVAVGLVLANDAFLNVAGWFYRFVPVPKL
ncbi:MAG TPA: cytochrome c biogenesis protein CcdA [Candidatus Dormibacteraeota bacterium]|nr:cytochrome c biogenesis protein CcdA [Candidatus Dormibacteraeota bacterium]